MPLAAILGPISVPPTSPLLPPEPPQDTAPPTISGNATAGQKLTASTGSWTGSPTSYAYQWQTCSGTSLASCVDIAGASAPSRTLGASDVGHTERVIVTAANASGSATAASAKTTVVALVGYSKLQADPDVNKAGSAEAFRYTSLASGTVNSLSLYVASSSSASSIVVGLYGDASGRPGALLTKATISSPIAGAWNTVHVPGVAVSAGSSYWLAALGLNGTLELLDVESGGGPAQSSRSSSLSTLPTSWTGGPIFENSPASFYASSEGTTPPPPPSPPTNTALPAVSGTTVQGRTLSTTNGAWTGSPTHYAYQWEDCDDTGANCGDIAGATSAGYVLAAADIGSTMRVVVSASNSAGEASATSASVGPVTGLQPTASFGYEPASPVVGEPVEFDGTSSACPDGPCTYEWSNDGSPTRPIPPLFPLGNGQTISLTFASAGTEYVRLVVTDVLGETATAERNVTVATEPPPPSPPSDTTKPAVSGAAEVGQTLTASKGTWSGSTPITYAYQWQRGGSTDIAGATASGYKPVAADVGHTLDVVVTATNSAGTSSATSAQTAAVTEVSSGQQTNCINAPSVCGYPDATNTGVPAGTTLTAQTNDINVTTPGTTIKDIALTGTIDVDANNTTIEDSEITVDGTQAGCNSPCGGKGIWTKPGVTGTIIRHVTCHGGAPTGDNVTEFCIQSNDSSTQVSYAHLYNCTTGFVGPGTWSNSFVDQTGATIPQEHYEDIYYGGGGGPLIVNHNTMLNPQGQTAVVFASVDFGNQTTLTITNNLMAGGGYMIYGGGSGSGGSVLGPVTITGNRFSRKYYPDGGYYGLDSYMTNSVTTWSGNIWDDTLKSAPEE